MSDFLVKEFQLNHGVTPAHMIPNAIEPSMYPVIAPSERQIDILGVGSLSRLKQYDVFIEVIGALRRTMPTINAMIWGEGEAREELEQLVEERRLEAHVALPGLTPHNEVLG